MSEAPRDGTPVLLKFRDGLEEIRRDLDHWNGLIFVGRNRSDEGSRDDWGFAAPVGMGGFPDSWFLGWNWVHEGIADQVAETPAS